MTLTASHHREIARVFGSSAKPAQSGRGSHEVPPRRHKHDQPKERAKKQLSPELCEKLKAQFLADTALYREQGQPQAFTRTLQVVRDLLKDGLTAIFVYGLETSNVARSFRHSWTKQGLPANKLVLHDPRNGRLPTNRQLIVVLHIPSLNA